MIAIKLDNGNLLIPIRAESPQGDIGDAMIEITKDHPEYEEWLPFAMDESGLVDNMGYLERTNQ